MNSLIVMGVAGCGKSSLGAALAAALQRPLVEGDDFHPPANTQKMSAGIPLTDADRAGWLDTLADQIAARPVVLTCSALRRAYRDRLRQADPGLRFVHLVIGKEDARRRIAQRAGAHFMVPTLADSQFATLESPAGEPGVIELDAMLPPAELLTAALTALGQEGQP